jgi:hypothetical protein
MKKILTLIFLANFSLSIINTNAQGVYVEYKLSSDKADKSMSGNNKTWHQDGNSRSEMEMNIPGLPAGAMNAVTITRQDRPNTIIKLTPSNKTYSEISYEEYEPQEKKSTEPFEVTVVGKETVNGYSCAHVIAKFKNSGKMRNEWWTSKDVPGFPGFSGMKGTKYFDDDSFFAKMAEKGADGFPVRMKMSEAGMGGMQMDLVKAEKKNIPSSMFEIPADYTKAAAMDMSNMPKSMQDLKNMTPEEQKKMMEDLMKMYGGEQPPTKP